MGHDVLLTCLVVVREKGSENVEKVSDSIDSSSRLYFYICMPL